MTVISQLMTITIVAILVAAEVPTDEYTLPGELATSEILLVSHCTSAQGRFCAFVQTALARDFPLVILNYNKTHVHNTDKIVTMVQFLQKVKDDQIIIFADCVDVLVNENRADVVTKFRETKKNIIFAVEYYCWPDEVIRKVTGNPADNGTCAQAYEIAQLKNTCVRRGPQYVNSGLYIGYAHSLRIFLSQVYEEILKQNRYGDDQRFFHEAFLLKKYGISADYCVDFFLCTLGMKNCGRNCLGYLPMVKQYTFQPTKKTSSFVHFEHTKKKAFFDEVVPKSYLSKYPPKTSVLYYGKVKKSFEEVCRPEDSLRYM